MRDSDIFEKSAEQFLVALDIYFLRRVSAVRPVCDHNGYGILARDYIGNVRYISSILGCSVGVLYCSRRIFVLLGYPFAVEITEKQIVKEVFRYEINKIN